MQPTKQYIPVFNDDPNVTKFPNKLKINPAMREKYRLARSILSDLVQEANHEIFMAMSWEKEDIREKQRMARLDLQRYHEALETIGRMNCKKNPDWDEVV